MNDEEGLLSDIRTLHAAASPGPWLADDEPEYWVLRACGGIKQILKAPKANSPYAEYWPEADDAAFLVEAHANIGFLLALVDDLRATSANKQALLGSRKGRIEHLELALDEAQRERDRLRSRVAWLEEINDAVNAQFDAWCETYEQYIPHHDCHYCGTNLPEGRVVWLTVAGSDGDWACADQQACEQRCTQPHRLGHRGAYAAGELG